MNPTPHITTPNQLSATARESVYQWILELASPETREHALLELRYKISYPFIPLSVEIGSTFFPLANIVPKFPFSSMLSST